MSDYVKKLMQKDPLRLVGYKAYTTCISKSVRERELQKFKETVAQVKKCCKELQNFQDWEDDEEAPKTEKKQPLINKILDSLGNLLKQYKPPVEEALLNKIKETGRALQNPEIKEILLNVAKAAMQKELKPLHNIADRFNIDPFINGFNGVITPAIKDNLKKLYKNIVSPIISHYKNEEIGGGFQVLKGVMSATQAIADGKTKESPFIVGKAIEFTIKGISSAKVYKDIVTQAIPITYGIIRKKKDSIEISLPYGKFKNNAVETHVDSDKVKAKMLESGSVLTF
jgi:hypothetical protein